MDRKEKTILVTILANGVLVGLKFILSAWSGSMALRVSGWHSVGDPRLSWRGYSLAVGRRGNASGPA